MIILACDASHSQRATVEAEARRRQIAGKRSDPVRVAPAAIPEQVLEHGVDPLARGVIAAGANDRHHRALGPLEVPGEQLHPDEAGRAREKDGAVGAGHSASSGDSERSAQHRRERV